VWVTRPAPASYLAASAPPSTARAACERSTQRELRGPHEKETTMKLLVLLILLSLAFPALSWAEKPWYPIGRTETPWYQIGMQYSHLGCFPMASPVDVLRMLKQHGIPYQLADITENGQVVATTITAPTYFNQLETYYRSERHCWSGFRTRMANSPFLERVPQPPKQLLKPHERDLEKYQ
jgi:hypothetical protein